jgi:hypothetical protein
LEVEMNVFVVCQETEDDEPGGTVETVYYEKEEAIKDVAGRIAEHFRQCVDLNDYSSDSDYWSIVRYLKEGRNEAAIEVWGGLDEYPKFNICEEVEVRVTANPIVLEDLELPSTDEEEEEDEEDEEEEEEEEEEPAAEE